MWAWCEARTRQIPPFPAADRDLPSVGGLICRLLAKRRQIHLTRNDPWSIITTSGMRQRPSGERRFTMPVGRVSVAFPTSIDMAPQRPYHRRSHDLGGIILLRELWGVGPSLVLTGRDCEKRHPTPSGYTRNRSNRHTPRDNVPHELPATPSDRRITQHAKNDPRR